jgi:ribonucleoside-diphosphate reductase alpha chain
MSDPHFHAPISEQIWDAKYRLRDENKQPLEADVTDTWRRIAKALAQAEKPADQAMYEAMFYSALKDFKFLPAGRITAGAGTGRNVTLFNCFVMGTVPDSMGGIFDMLKEAALTMQQGGGIGYDFSTLRPKGSLVKGVAADASGPLTFMDCWDSMCRTVMSAGSRRGAMMATMRCDHPDIEMFIEAKRDPLKLRMFNLSVLVTDDFMAAVKADADWRLHFENRAGETLAEKTIKARDLWTKIMRSTYNFAEPGVIFIDRINQANNLKYMEKIASTNPCGEQPLPPYGACLLGSINLPALVKNAFQTNAGIDRRDLENMVSIAIRMMDNVVDVSNFPLAAQEDEARLKRRLGLGVTGLADALVMCGLTYGSVEAAQKTETWMAIVENAAYHASIKLAQEKGCFPGFSVDGYLAEGTHASTLPRDITDGIRKHGIRNSHLTSIAPTGTISLYAGNLSSGVEPIFALTYDRKVLNDDGTKRTEAVEDFAFAAWKKLNPGVDPAGPNGMPSAFVSAQTLEPMAHVRMQAAAQKHVDSSISKTINCPVDISFEDFCEVYMAAWDSGCKGCTTYRPNEVTGSILSVTEAPAKAAETVAVAEAAELVSEAPAGRPDELDGTTYKLKWPGSNHSIYINITNIEEGGKLRPFEVFINSKNMEHFAWTVALTRMISAVFRRPHDSTFVVEELKAVFDPKGGAWMDGKYVPSILAAIGGVIEKHMKAIGYIPGEAPAAPAPPRKIAMNPLLAAPYGQEPAPPMCPACHSSNVKKEAGCFVCKDCGNSNCG